MELFDQSLTILEKTLDVRMANQRLIASNLANVDTPGYTAQKLDFEQTMAEAIAQPDDVKPTPIIEPSQEASLTPDGNNVDMEGELADLSQNKFMYNLTAQLVAAKLRQLSSVITQQ